MLDGADSVDTGEGKAEEPVIANVSLELGTNFCGELDGLAGGGGCANRYGVREDNAA